ncbi:MAG: protein kinase [Flavobacteriaceae bacterium]|nr:protein kinase [Flavobacteriaceae bacterium]
MYSGNPHCRELSDLWSSGVVLYALLTGNLPYDGNNFSEIFRSINMNRVNYPSYLSKEAKGLLKSMLNPKIKERISLREIKFHSWF